MNKPRAVFFGNRQDLLTHVYPDSRVERLKALADVHPVIVSKDNFDDLLPELSEIDYIFSTWGMPRLTPAQIKQMSALKMVFYGAGTVKYFAEPFLQQGIRVVSAWAANGIPVAEFTVAQMTLAAKGYFGLARRLGSEGASAWQPTKARGNYEIEISIPNWDRISIKIAFKIVRNSTQIISNLDQCLIKIYRNFSKILVILQNFVYKISKKVSNL